MALVHRRLSRLFALAVVAGILCWTSAAESRPRDNPSAVVLEKDGELRAKFAKSYPEFLPEKRRRLPKVEAKSFDWVKTLGLTPVHFQGGLPNCTAQSCIAAMEWNWQIRNGGKAKPELSPQPIVDQLEKRGSLSFTEALNTLLRYGTAEISKYPYTGEPREVNTKVPRRYRIIGWGQVAPYGKTTVPQIKQALLDHGPLLIDVNATEAFKRYKGGVFSEKAPPAKSTQPTNHAVVLIGWDDTKGKNGCWRLQNSWGLQWGDGGACWIEYDSNHVGWAAFWLTTQSTQYHLPPDIHNDLGEGALPFYRWPSARELKK